jgi:site-specific DNA recombinase
MRNGKLKPAPSTTVRCAIYTRKSTEEGLEQEFNSLDAQRESGESFIKSQQHEGWVLLPDRYDDGGFTGGNIDRPAMKRLLADVEAGKIDAVVVYKVDRLSRSLLDFTKLMEVFDKRKVSFVSVTQQFNTATSMGRLVLNVLLSFAQFEREIISERTRDKIAAARRKGQWAGGMPVLGYDVDPTTRKLVINEKEAKVVRAVFDLYLEHRALLPVVRELTERGLAGKRWTTRKGRARGGEPFSRTGLYRLLTNALYAGQVRYKGEVYRGEHQPIVAEATFAQVQTVLKQNGASGGASANPDSASILRGLLRCGPCGCAMSASHTTKNRAKRYRYYVCTNAAKRGWAGCPSKSVPAGTIEMFVVEQVREVGLDQAVRREVVAQARAQERARREEVLAEQKALAKDLAGWHAQVRREADGVGADGALARLADLHERAGAAERRLAELRGELERLGGAAFTDAQAAEALRLFGPVFGALTPAEQGRALRLLVEKVEYDGAKGSVAVTFRPGAVAALAGRLGEESK